MQSRKLAAVMFTDLVGYTALMGKDSEKALSIIQKSRDLQKPIVEKYHGKWLKEMGDGAMALFETALEAVKCALEIQKKAKSELSASLRIGIHAGDITHVNQDIYGDGVNIASRLEAIADPGGIYISDTIEKAIQGEKRIQAKYLGEIPLKGVRYKVRTYALQDDFLPFPQLYKQQKRTSWVKPTVYISLLIIIITVMIAVFFFPGIVQRKQNQPDQTTQRMESSVAVLPFRDLSPSQDQGYFVDGLSEELLNRLAQLPELMVVGRTSSFQFTEENPDLIEIGNKLGVSFILTGSVRRQDQEVRVTARLFNAGDGLQLWSESYNRTLDNIFAVQDDISESVAQAMNVVMNDEKRERMRAAGIRSVEAFVAFQKGFELFDLAHSGKVDIIPTLQKAKEQFDEATRYAPSFGQAYFLKSDYYAHQILTASSESEGQEAVRNFQLVLDSAYANTPDPQQRAIVDFERVLFSDDWRFMDDRIRQVLEEPGCAQPDWFEVAAGFGYQDGVYDVYRRAWECNPLSTLASHRAAFMALWDGRPDESLEIMEEAINRIGNNSWFSAMKARAYVSQGRFEEARQEASKVMLDEPVFGNTQILVEAAAGDLDKARKLAADRQQIMGQPEIRNLQVLVALGQQEQINHIVAETDRHPGGSGRLASVISSCQCGAPFDLEATPNFRKQLEKSGLSWPPPSPIKYPAKDW